MDSGGRTHAYFYNNLYELTSETHPDFTSISYSYDANGNRTSRNQNGAVDYYGVDAANRLQWVNRGSNVAPTAGQASPYTLFSHDSNGRITRRERRHDGGLLRAHDFVWDSQNRLQEVKEGATTKFTADYNGGGLRVAKWDAWTGQHDYSWGPGGVLHDSSGNTTYTPGLGHRSNGVDRCYHEDRHGSTRYMSDSTGNTFPTALRYDAYGQRTATSGPAHPSDMLFGAEAGYQTEYADGSDPGLGLPYCTEPFF